MSGMSTTRDASFQDRLNKITNKSAPAEPDPMDKFRAFETGAAPAAPVKPEEVQLLPDWKENIKYPATLVGASLLGMVSVFVARYARYHLTGTSLSGSDPDITMLIDGGIAAGAGFLLFSLFRFSAKEYKFAQTVGIMIMVCVMHNFVHSAPKTFGVLFSPEWTEEVIAMTEPGSILFRGVSFVVNPPAEDVAAAEPEPEVKKLPTVRRMN